MQKKNNAHLLFVLRKDGNKYAPFLALDKNGRKQTRYVKIKTEGISKSAIQKAKLKRLHELNYVKEHNIWKKEQPTENVLLLISIGDYKHVKFDIIIKRIFSADDFKNLIERDKTIEAAHERIRNETISQAVQLLRSKGHFGLASMLKNNTDIDYVAGGEYTFTDEQPQDVEFTRFDIRNDSRLEEIKTKREIPKNYDKDKQQKIEVD